MRVAGEEGAVSGRVVGIGIGQGEASACVGGQVDSPADPAPECGDHGAGGGAGFVHLREGEPSGAAAEGEAPQVGEADQVLLGHE